MKGEKGEGGRRKGEGTPEQPRLRDRSRGVPYVAVDEAKRSVLSDGGSIKSLRFTVSTPGPPAAAP